jgi:hypothetical protein
VRSFEQRCQTRAAAGEWWLDENGNSGPVGGPAIYNVSTCRPLTSQDGFTSENPQTKGLVHFLLALDLQRSGLGHGELGVAGGIPPHDAQLPRLVRSYRELTSIPQQFGPPL